MSSPPKPGQILAGRYQVLEFPLLLDTSPAEPPLPLDSVPPLAVPYLALSRFPVAIPRPFTQITLPDTGEPLLLLEEIPIGPGTSPSKSGAPALLPSLLTAWAAASALQQVTWLWQLARLWHPCEEEQVAGALLDWDNIRVDDDEVRLLSLTVTEQMPSLADLGRLWHPLSQTAAPPLQGYLTQLTQKLMAGQASAPGLVASLTQALEFLAAQYTVAVQWATDSDQGPTRQRNEDACYPPPGTTDSVVVPPLQTEKVPAPFVVVCDGIGGHQGGDVASQLAIAQVTQHLQNLTARPDSPHAQVVAALEQAIFAANQAIAERNDADQRQYRDRMGTTLVMVLVCGARLYIAHLGDSRAYRVRSHQCRQITLDDDVAARDMRLGLGLYQDALQAPGSGALVQALGMADARHLHPTIDLHPVTTPSLLLLCSDGLSDQGLVDRLWVPELRPVLQGDRAVATASKRLIDLANTHNGHDNVTVGLLRMTPKSPATLRNVPIELADSILVSSTPDFPITPHPAPPPTQHLPSPPPTSKPWRLLPLLLTGGIMAVLVGVIATHAWNQLAGRTPSPTSPAPETGATLSPTAAPPRPSQVATPGNLAVGDLLQVQRLPETGSPPTLLTADVPPTAPLPAAVEQPERTLVIGSIVQVIRRQKTPDNQVWVRLQVCSLPPVESETGTVSETESPGAQPPLPLAEPGDQGWVLETSLPTFADPLLDTSPTQQGSCTN